MDQQTRRLDELERAFREICALVSSVDGAFPKPGELVQQIRSRLEELENLRLDLWEARYENSRNLASRQIDELISGSSRKEEPAPDVVIERRSPSTGAPLFCLLMAVDPPAVGSEDPTLYHFLLVQAAQRILLTTRSGDLLLRYREEGFLLISDSQFLHQAKGHAARLSQAVGGEPVSMGDRDLGLSLTISVVRYEQSIGGANECIRLAWQALRKAQADRPGQNCSLPVGCGLGRLQPEAEDVRELILPTSYRTQNRARTGHGVTLAPSERSPRRSTPSADGPTWAQRRCPAFAG